MTIFDTVNTKIIELLEKNIIPWQQTWIKRQPLNAITQKEYRGINRMILNMQKYESNQWVTFNQCKQLGGSVLKGEHGTYIVYYTFTKTENQNGQEVEIQLDHPIYRAFVVFNVNQCNIPTGKIKEEKEYETTKLTSIDDLIKYEIEIKPSQTACYTPKEDVVYMPQVEQFKDQYGYYEALFHELSHSTGHPKRLNRFTLEKILSEDYGKEELIAEISASYLLYEAGFEVRESSAGYIKGWLESIKKDKTLIMSSFGYAEKAYEMILGRTNEQHD